MTTLTGREKLRLFGAGGSGTFVEFYDFAIYGFSIPVIAAQFFPPDDRPAAIIAALTVFAGSYLARPLGAVYFGRLGDRIGRRTTLMIVILTMGAATVAVGVLPPYAAIGLAAPVLLGVARLVQGFSAGGEVTGVTLLLAEHAPAGRAARYVSTMGAAAQLGVVAAIGTVLVSTATLTPDDYAAWGWRVPFLLGGVLSLVSLYLRLRVDETPAFVALRAAAAVERTPLRSALREHGRTMVLIGLLFSALGIASTFLAGYAFTFLTVTIELSPAASLGLLMAVYVVMAVLLPVAGAVADPVGRRSFLVVANTALAVLALPAFLLMSTGSVGAAFVGIAVVALGAGANLAVLYVLALEVFPAAVRYTGAGVSFTVSIAVFGGTAPLVAALLVSATGSATAPGYYLAAAAALVAVLAARALPPGRTAGTLTPSDQTEGAR